MWFSVQEEEMWTVKYICPIVQFERQTLVSLQHITYSKLAANVVIYRLEILRYNQLSSCYLDKTELITLREKIQGVTFTNSCYVGCLYVANHVKNLLECFHSQIWKSSTCLSWSWKLSHHLLVFDMHDVFILVQKLIGKAHSDFPMQK